MSPDPTVPVKKLPRGAKPTPRHKLCGSEPFRPIPTLMAPPTQFAVVPKQLSMWDNDVDGDCVTAEEAFAKAAFSVMSGLPELFVPVQEVISWASQYGFLNGANLTDVMDQMAKKGFQINGVLYGDGPYQAVDYSNEAVLQAALVQGPVKIGIDADALPGGAGNANGWVGTGGSPGQFSNEDHCVSLTGYGPASYLFEQLGVPLPSGLAPTANGYLLFTWSTIGFVDHAWIMSTCGEAWVRNPTTPGESPTPVPPGPTPVPNPPVPTPPGPTPVPTTPGFVVIPNQTVQVPHGLFGTASVTIQGGTYPVQYGSGSRSGPVGAINWTELFSVVTADIAAGKTFAQIVTDVITVLVGGTPTTATGAKLVGLKVGLTPAQWQAIIQTLLQLLPIFFGS